MDPSDVGHRAGLLRVLFVVLATMQRSILNLVISTVCKDSQEWNRQHKPWSVLAGPFTLDIALADGEYLSFL